ncbi:MAG: hypothetical protein XD53_1536 [Petrotoga mobilis]|nr:MAG: hypothetical protein XD53_1536 [Petrotoga mobilis]
MAPSRVGDSLQSMTFYPMFLFILPMRNGNGLTWRGVYGNILTFYPTYEEWKQKFHFIFSFASFTFYPTYEEWKPRTMS